MGDGDEAGLGAPAHLVEHVAEAVDVGVVERGIDLVEHADRRGLGEEDGEDQGGRGQRLFAAAHQAHDSHALARGAREYLQAGLQRVLGLDQPQLGLAALEQGLEQRLEVLVDHLESGDQTLAALGVQLIDAVAQAGDRAGQVGALGLHDRQALGVFDGLFLGAQVDRSDGVALALQVVEVGLDAAGIGGQRHGLVGQLLGQGLRLDAGGLADLG